MAELKDIPRLNDWPDQDVNTRLCAIHTPDLLAQIAEEI